MLEVAGHEVRLSNPGKVYFPKPGWTKLDLVEYYLAAADAVLIHLRERPTVMKRFVNGINEDPIWQKRVPKNLPEWLQTATVAFPVRPHRRGARGQRRGAPRVGGQPRRDRLQPAPGAARRSRPSGRAARRPRPDAGGRLGGGPQDRDGRQRGAERARAARLPEGQRLQGHPRQRADRADPRLHRGPPRRAGAGARGRTTRARPRDEQVVEGGAPRRLRRLQPERARSHRRLRLHASGRRRTPASPARWPGTRCPTPSRATCGSTPCRSG